MEETTIIDTYWGSNSVNRSEMFLPNILSLKPKPRVFLCDGGYSTPPCGMIDGKYKLSKEEIHSMYVYIEHEGKKILFDTGYDKNNCTHTNATKILFLNLSYFEK
jgi:hypothetical protein